MLVLFTLIGCPALLPSSDPEPVCGDGVWASTESCDPADVVYGPWCTDTCTWQTCGDNVVGPDEGCEPPSLLGTCGPDCLTIGCGNGTRDLGELCLDALEPLEVGVGAQDLALTDADGDGDPDLLVAAPEGARLWLNDGGRFDRSALIIPVTAPVAVAAVGRTLLALHAGGVSVAHWYALDHTVVLHPHGGVTPCTSARPASLSVGDLGVSRHATWTCNEGAFNVIVNDRTSFPPNDGGLELSGATTAFAVTPSATDLPRLWDGLPEEAFLTANSPPGRLDLPEPARAIRLPFTIEPLGAQLVVLHADSMSVAAGTSVSITLPTPGVIDGTAGWWADGSVHDRSGLDAVYLDADGVAFYFSEGGYGTVSRGPNLPGLTRVLVADLDGDGHQDVVALRPAAGEVHVWFQRP